MMGWTVELIDARSVGKGDFIHLFGEVKSKIVQVTGNYVEFTNDLGETLSLLHTTRVQVKRARIMRETDLENALSGTMVTSSEGFDYIKIIGLWFLMRGGISSEHLFMAGKEDSYVVLKEQGRGLK